MTHDLDAPLFPRRTPATFVLVHGAWHGGWCWQRVVDRLTAKGHRVFAPTLTGLGERSHLLNESVNLTTHSATSSTRSPGRISTASSLWVIRTAAW
jgi:dienelactone hydrolase